MEKKLPRLNAMTTKMHPSLNYCIVIVQQQCVVKTVFFHLADEPTAT